MQDTTITFELEVAKPIFTYVSGKLDQHDAIAILSNYDQSVVLQTLDVIIEAQLLWRDTAIQANGNPAKIRMMDGKIKMLTDLRQILLNISA